MSTQIQVEKVRPGVGGNSLSPSPTPPITAVSCSLLREFVTTLGWEQG